MLYKATFVLAVLFTLILTPLPSTPAAYACSGGFMGSSYQERIAEAYGYVRSVVLAEIVDSRVIQPGGGPVLDSSGRPTFVQADGTIASFRPQVLWSDTGLTGNTVGPLGYISADCSGGPSLVPGDKVLLFLRPLRQHLGGIASYEIGVFGDTILFRGDEAFFLHPARRLEPAGSTREVIDAVIRVAGSAERTRGPAFTFLDLDPAIPALLSTSTQTIRPPVAGNGGLLR